ncbi:MAG: ABC transporter permease subunit [Acidimicrobiia bacterium]
MSVFIALLVSGAVAGGLYALLATGLVLTYDTSGIFDFAHAAVAYVCALMYFLLRTPEGADWPTAAAFVLSVLVIAPALGFLLDRVMFRALARAPEVARIVATIGLLVALPALTRVVLAACSASGVAVPDTTSVIAVPGLGPVPPVVWNPLARMAVNSDELLVLVIAAAAAIGLWWLLRRTRFGLLTRAAVDDRELASLRGVDVERISTVSWVIGFVLAGVTGVLITPLYQLDPGVFTLLMVGAFTAVVFARFRSLPLAFAGGLAVGIVQNLAYGYLPPAMKGITGMRSAVPFALLFAVVLWRGSSTVRPAGAAVREAPPADASARSSVMRSVAPWVTFAVVGAVALIVANNLWATLLAKGVALGLVFLSFVVITGIGGVVSLAQAAFVTVSGLAVGLLTSHQFDRTMPVLMHNGRLAFGVALAIAIGLAALLGAGVALVSLRISGLAFAISTLALGLLGEQLVFRSEWFGNGTRGWVVTPPTLGPIDLGQPRQMAVAGFILCVVVAGSVSWLRTSRLGRAAQALRSSEPAVRACGISPIRTRAALFAVSASIAALGGALLAVTTSPFSGSTFPALVGLVWLAVVVTFGVRRPFAAVVAGVVVAVWPQAMGELARVSFLDWMPAAFLSVLASPYLPDVLFGLGAIGYSRDPEGFVHALGSRHRPTQSTPTPSMEPPSVAPAPALSVCNVSTQRGGRVSLRDIVLHVAPYEGVVLCGPNGGGKTSLIRVLAGLDPTAAGSVSLAGEDVTYQPPHERARRGLVTVPAARAVFPNLTVAENIALGVRNREHQAAVFARFPVLAARRQVRASSCSGGEQRLLAVALAAPASAIAMVVDEPSAGLAPKAAAAVRAELAVRRQAGSALVLATERAGVDRDLANRTVQVVAGRLVGD